MAWDKDVFFLKQTDTDWTNQNPILPNGAIIAVEFASGDIRIKIGDGNRYIDTNYVNKAVLDTKHTIGSSATKVVFEDGHTEELNTLTIQDIIDAGYHLVTDAEWDVLKLASILPPTAVATPAFSLATKEIGESQSGGFVFNFVKTNNDNFKETTGGNITVNQGAWSGLGDFDLKGNSSKTITASGFTLNSAGTLTFTLYGRDIYDQQVSLQTFNIDFHYPIWGGTKVDQTLTSQGDLSNLVKRVAASADELEFYLDPNGSTHYFHLLIPTEIASNIDIRDLSSPSPGSANMVLQGTVLLTVGSISKTYNHYVSSYTSADQVDFLIKEID